MRITHNASFTPPGYRRRYYWLLARPRCPGSELPSWSQCAMSSVRARTLHSPRSVHAAHYARLLAGASCSRSKCQQPGDNIRDRNRWGVSLKDQRLFLYSVHILNWIKSEYCVLLNWTALFKIDGNDLGVYSEGEFLYLHKLILETQCGKNLLNIIPISCTMNYKSCKCRTHKIYFLKLNGIKRKLWHQIRPIQIVFHFFILRNLILNPLNFSPALYLAGPVLR